MDEPAPHRAPGMTRVAAIDAGVVTPESQSARQQALPAQRTLRQVAPDRTRKAVDGQVQSS